jgi:inner membrane protein
MLYKGHLTAGVMVAATAAIVLEDSALVTATACLFSCTTALLPDLDSPTSKISQKLPLVKIAKVIAIFVMLYSFSFLMTFDWKDFIIYFFTSGFIYMSLGHRKLLHSLLFVIPLSFVIYKYIGVNNTILTGITIGLISGLASHLLGDLFTKDGIPLLYPIPFRFRIGWFTAGKNDKIICSIILVLCLIVLAFHLVF